VAESKRRWHARNREAINAARRIDRYPPRICATCGQEFAPIRRDQRYCRRWCREHRYLRRFDLGASAADALPAPEWADRLYASQVGLLVAEKRGVPNPHEKK
jgi:hypothetical protein